MATKAVDSAKANLRKQTVDAYYEGLPQNPATTYEAQEKLRPKKQQRVLRFGIAATSGLLAIGAFMQAISTNRWRFAVRNQ